MSLAAEGLVRERAAAAEGAEEGAGGAAGGGGAGEEEREEEGGGGGGGGEGRHWGRRWSPEMEATDARMEATLI